MKNTEKIGFRTLLKTAMKNTGTKQTDIANILGITKGTMSVRFKSDKFDINAYLKIMRAMGYTVTVSKGDERYELVDTQLIEM